MEQGGFDRLSSYLKNSTYEEWVLVTALRGPDDGDSELKSVTTAVIRYVLAGYEKCPFMSYDIESAKIIWSAYTPEVKKRIKDKLLAPSHSANHHFASHIWMALRMREELRDYSHWLKDELMTVA